jgi:hypothetical protein
MQLLESGLRISSPVPQPRCYILRMKKFLLAAVLLSITVAPAFAWAKHRRHHHHRSHYSHPVVKHPVDKHPAVKHPEANHPKPDHPS